MGMILRTSAVLPQVILQYRQIDGGPTFYNDNGFSVAVTAGFDDPGFYEIGCWPARLTTPTKYATYQDLGINAASLITSDSDQSLAGTGSSPPVWWCLSLEDASVKSFVTAAGAEVPILNTFDEPGNWVSDVGNYIAGTSGNLTSPTSTTKANGRPQWMNRTYQVAYSVLTATPSPTTPAAEFSSTVTDRGGATRHVDLASIDNYWISTASDPYGASGIFGVVGNYYQLNGAPTVGGSNYNSSSTSMAVPTSFTATRTFTTTANKGFQIGAACLVARGSAGSRSVMVGAITAYTSSTGSMTISIPATRSYTTGVNSAGATQIFLPADGADGFIWTLGGVDAPIVTDTTVPARIPAGTVITSLSVSGNGFVLNVSNAVTCQTGDTILITTTCGSTSSFTDWGVHVATTVDQARRIVHYGATIDLLRGYQYNSTPSGSPALPLGAPIGQFLDVLGPYGNQFVDPDYVTPPELNGMAWVHIMHGGRRFHWFNLTAAGVPATDESVQSTYCRGVQASNTISTYNQMKTTNTFIKKMAKVINSPFVMNYATISPNGFTAPFPGSYAQNNGTAFPAVAATSTFYNADLACLDGTNVASWEVATKYYTGATSGILVTNSYYLMIAFRGGRLGSPSLTFTCTIATPFSSVTRIYLDCVIDAGASIANPSTRTQIQVANTDQMKVGDTVLIENTNGVTGLNGTFTIPSGGIVDATHIDILLVFSGTLVLPRGTILVTHAMSMSTSGLTFTDTFFDITDVRIYRVS